MGTYHIGGMNITAKNLDEAIKKRAKIDIQKEREYNKKRLAHQKRKTSDPLKAVEDRINKLAYGY